MIKNRLHIFSFLTVCILTLTIIQTCNAAVFISTTGGTADYFDDASWVGGVAPNATLAPGDTVIINSPINLDGAIVINGHLQVNVGGSLIGAEKVEIGKPGDDEGSILNYGTIDVASITIKPKNAIGLSDDSPSFENYGTVITSGNLHIGDNDQAGVFINYAGGSVTVGGDIHQDNLLINYDTITVAGTWKNHGGRVEGCGVVNVSTIEFDDNGTRTGSFGCIDVCNGGNSPVFEIKGGATYNDPNTSYFDLITGEGFNGSQNTIDSADTYICGVNYGGGTNPLPLRLLDFNIRAKNEKVQIQWINLASHKNDYIEVQRSFGGGLEWEIIDQIIERSNSIAKAHSIWDEPFGHQVVYYRLKQIDFNGKTSYSKTKAIRGLSKNVVKIFPNPTKDLINIKLYSLKTEGLEVYLINSTGQSNVLNIGSDSNEKGMYQCDLSDINPAPGIYSLQIRTNSWVRISKLIIY